MRRSAVLLLVLLNAAGASAQQSSPLDRLSFLIGEWEPVGGAAAGGAVFYASLQGRVLIRNSHAEYPGSATVPASHHEDLMLVYAEREAMRADYYDNEGHVIRYLVSVPAPGQAVFLSNAESGAPRYRLTYTLGTDGRMGGLFEIAPPGQPDAFSKYLAWDTVRKGAAPPKGTGPRSVP